MRLAIGLLVAHGFPVHAEFWDAYEQLSQHVQTGASNALLPAHLQIEGVRRIRSTAFPIDVARNEIVRAFLAGDESHLFFLDADHTFAPDLLARLLAHDEAVVSARYHMRREPFHAVAYVKHREKEGPHTYQPIHFGKGLVEIERGGAGALLIRRDVLEAIQFRIGDNWFRYQRGPDPPHDFTVSEDFWFYQQAREAGYRCYCDWETEAQHLQLVPIGLSWNGAYLDAQIRALETMPPDERQRTVNNLVVCGYPDGYVLPTGDRVAPYVVTPGER